MSDWLHELPIAWMAVIVLAAVALVVAAIHVAVTRLSVGPRGEAMRSVSPGLLPALGIIFALIVGFLAVGVWGDADKAKDDVSTEASALRSVVLLSDQLPGTSGDQLRVLVRRHIDQAVHEEWPAMAKGRAKLATIPAALAQALDLTLAVAPRNASQIDAQREIVTALERSLDARRQRVIVSGSRVNLVKWLGLLALAVVMLVAIACVHSASRTTTAIAMALYGAAVAVVVVMLLAQDRPFTGPLGQKPDLLEQVRPPA